MSQISRSASLAADRSLETKQLLFDGIILIDKPVGSSSAKTLARVKHAMGDLGRQSGVDHERTRGNKPPKMGHGGTLDPFASGLLVCLVGRATRLLFLVHGSEKEYLARVKFGEQTLTDDLCGAVIRSTEVRPTLSAITTTLSTFVGEIDQLPPQVSARKIAGERAYNKVRRGETVELKPKRVKISAITVEGVVPEHNEDNILEITLRIRCSSGTYIRAIARDLGIVLGCGGHLIELRRTRSEPFSVVDAVAENEFLKACQEAASEEIGLLAINGEGTQEDRLSYSRGMYPWYTLCADRERVAVSESEVHRLYCGHQSTIAEVGARSVKLPDIGDVIVVEDDTGIPRGLLIYQQAETWQALMMSDPRQQDRDEILVSKST